MHWHCGGGGERRGRMKEEGLWRGGGGEGRAEGRGTNKKQREGLVKEKGRRRIVIKRKTEGRGT